MTGPVEAEESVRAPNAARRPRFFSAGELLLIAVFFVTALTSIAVTRNVGGSSLLWPANAIAAAGLVRWPTLRWGRVLAGLLLAGAVANVLGANDAPLGSLAMSAADVLEVALTTYVFRGYVQLPFPNITFGGGIQLMLLLGLVLPAISAVFGGVAVSETFGTPWTEAASNWFTATSSGAILYAPAIYLYSSKAVERLVAPDVRIANITLVVGCLVITYCSMRFSRFPLLTLSIPLLIVGFRIGAFGAAATCEATGLLVVFLWVLKVRAGGPAVPLAGSGEWAGIPFVVLAVIMISPIILGFAADDRDRAMRALRYNEQRFRQSLRHSPTGIVMRGLDGRITMVNDAFLKTFGYTWDDLSLMTAHQLVHPDDQVESNRDMQTLLDGTATAYVAERRYRHRNGSWVWVRVAVSLVDGDDGAPMHFIGHIESLEAGRRAERDLAEERERLKTTLRAIGEAVITTDAVGQITYVNAAAENLIGQRLEAIAGRCLDEVVVLTNPQTMKVTSSVFAVCVARGSPVRRGDRCLLHRPDGSPCYVIDTASPVNDPDGALSGVVVVLQDATAIVERERELSHRAAHDPLTGLTNRFELERRLAECFERHRHIERTASLLLIDLDRFKAVNDTGGHAAGDEVLRRVAQTLTAIVRESDTVSRFGGDEFALLITHSDPARAELVGAKVLRAVSELEVEWNGASHTVGASIGISSLSSRIGSVSEWIATADRVCYEAKRAGRGQMRIAA